MRTSSSRSPACSSSSYSCWGSRSCATYIRRQERQDALPSAAPEVMLRLERMEQAIDSIAVEVERISEGQRFTTKLLSERPAAEKKLNG